MHRVLFIFSNYHSHSPLTITARHKLLPHLSGMEWNSCGDTERLELFGKRKHGGSLYEREEGESEATPWPESILILVNINRLGSVTSTHEHFTRRLLIKTHQRQKCRINNREIIDTIWGGHILEAAEGWRKEKKAWCTKMILISNQSLSFK